MKFGNFQKTNKGFSLTAKSKFLSFILKIYAKRIIKKARKKDMLPMSKNINANIWLKFDFEVEDEK